MTILNIDHSPQRILVIVDTQGSKPDGTLCAYQKAFVLAPLNAVIAGSGDGRFFTAAHMAAMAAMQNEGQDFDQLCEAMPDYLLRIFNEMHVVIQRAGAPPLTGAQSVILAGPSSAGEMRALNFTHHTDQADPLCREFEPLHIRDAILWGPTPTGFDLTACPNNRDEWISAVRLQRDMALAEYGRQFAAGGALSIYTLSPDRIEIDRISADHAW